MQVVLSKLIIQEYEVNFFSFVDIQMRTQCETISS